MPVSQRLRFEIFKKHNFTCQYCGRHVPEITLELDHIIPRSLGGTDEYKNLTTTCRDCNQGKGSIPLETIYVPKETDWLHEFCVQYGRICQACRKQFTRKSGLLTIHHIRAIDHDDDIYNMILLCKKCHNRIEKKLEKYSTTASIRDAYLRRKPKKSCIPKGKTWQSVVYGGSRRKYQN